MFSAGKWIVLILFASGVAGTLAPFIQLESGQKAGKFEYGFAGVCAVIAIVTGAVFTSVEFFENTEDDKKKKY